MIYEELIEYLDYNENTGVFTWKIDMRPNKYKGDAAGGVGGRGYIIIGIKGKIYKAHRLAWLFMKKKEAVGDIDHINHDRLDNRFCNLRIVSKRENARNRSLSIENKSGVHGVNFKRNRWEVTIGVDGRNIYLGGYALFSDAVNIRKNAEVLYGFHENHGEEF